MNVFLSAYGVGDELLNPEAPQALLSEIISNALPQPLMKDGKMNNELSVSCHAPLFFVNSPLWLTPPSSSTFQNHYKTEVPRALSQRAPAA